MTTFDALGDADLAIETVQEDPALKRQILRELDRRLAADHPIVINTSTLSITELAADTSRPERILGMHFLYPVTTTRVVEVVRGQLTSDEVYERAVEFGRLLGKVPIKVFEMPGFVTTRVVLPLINEAMHVVMEGVAEPAEVDLAIKLGYEFRIGPLEWADRTGLDRILNWMQHLHDETGEPASVRARCSSGSSAPVCSAPSRGAASSPTTPTDDAPTDCRMISPGSASVLSETSPMKILVLNSGSSSVKFQVIETDLERMEEDRDLTLAVGQVEKIGLSDSRLILKVPDRPAYQDYREVLEHRAAIDWALRVLTDPEHGVLGSVEEIEAVGHRVVHGGEEFASSVLIDAGGRRQDRGLLGARPAPQPGQPPRLPRSPRGAPAGPSHRGLRHRLPPDHAGPRLPVRHPVPALHQAPPAPLRVPRHLPPLRLLPRLSDPRLGSR